MKITYSQRLGIPLIKIRHSRTIGIGVDGSGRIVIEKFEVSLAQVERTGIIFPVVDTHHGNHQLLARLHRNILARTRNHKHP